MALLTHLVTEISCKPERGIHPDVAHVRLTSARAGATLIDRHWLSRIMDLEPWHPADSFAPLIGVD